MVKIKAFDREAAVSDAALQGNIERIALAKKYESERLALLDENFAREKDNSAAFWNKQLEQYKGNAIKFEQVDKSRLAAGEKLEKQHVEARKAILKEIYDSYTKSIDGLIGLEQKHRDKALEYANEILDLYKTQEQKLFEIDQIGLTDAEVISKKRKRLADLETQYLAASKAGDFKLAKDLAEQKNQLAEELFKNEKNRKAELAKLDNQAADARVAYNQKIRDFANDDPKSRPEKIQDARVELNNKLKEIELERQKIGQQTNWDIERSKNIYKASTDDIASAINGLKGIEESKAQTVNAEIANQIAAQKEYKLAIEETNKTLLSGLKTITIDIKGDAALKTAEELNKAFDNAARKRTVVFNTVTSGSSNIPAAQTGDKPPSLDSGGGVYEDGLAMIHKNEFMLNPTGTKIASSIIGLSALAGMNKGNMPKLTSGGLAGGRQNDYIKLDLNTPAGVIPAKVDDTPLLRRVVAELTAQARVS